MYKKSPASRSSSPSGGNIWNDFETGFEHRPLADIQHNFESMMMSFDSKKISGFHTKESKKSKGIQSKSSSFSKKPRKRKRKVVPRTSTMFTPLPKLLTTPTATSTSSFGKSLEDKSVTTGTYQSGSHFNLARFFGGNIGQ